MNAPRRTSCSSASVMHRRRSLTLSISPLADVLFAMLSSSYRFCGCALVVGLSVVPAVSFAQGADAGRDTLRLSVDDAVAIALRQSDEVGLAAAQVDVADAQYGAARANGLPQLRISGSYLHVYQSARGQAVGSVFNQPNTYIGAVNFSQTLFQGGKLVSAPRAADELREAARFDEREQRANVTLLVQRSYLQALFTDRIAQLQQEN